MIIQAIIAPIASEAVLAAAGGIFDEAFPVYGKFAAILGGYIGSLLGALIAFAIARWVQKQLKLRFVDKFTQDDPMEDGSFDAQLEPGYFSRMGTKIANFLARFIDEDSDDFVEVIEQRGFEFVLIGRLLIFIPFDAVSYGSGLTRIKFRDYFIATLIGTLPRVIMLVLIGESFKEKLLTNFLSFMLVFSAVVLLILGAYYLSMRFLRKKYQNKIHATTEY